MSPLPLSFLFQCVQSSGRDNGAYLAHLEMPTPHYLEMLFLQFPLQPPSPSELLGIIPQDFSLKTSHSQDFPVVQW